MAPDIQKGVEIEYRPHKEYAAATAYCSGRVHDVGTRAGRAAAGSGTGR
jgi:hypothetical protein